MAQCVLRFSDCSKSELDTSATCLDLRAKCLDTWPRSPMFPLILARHQLYPVYVEVRLSFYWITVYRTYDRTVRPYTVRSYVCTSWSQPARSGSVGTDP
jgi:hypothetical protein